MNSYVLAAMVCAALAGGARAQCDQPFTIDLFSSVRDTGEPTDGQAQDPRSAWKFSAQSVFGTQLSGLVNSLGVGFWGDPTQPFFVPLAGGVCSPDAGVNRTFYHDRPFSFNGVFLHPGYGSRDLYATFWPTRQVTLLGAEFRGEVVGDISNGVQVRMVAHRNSTGSDVTLIPLSSVFYTTSGSTLLSATAGTLPLSLNGDNEYVALSVANLGEPSEDWLSGQVTLTMRGGPVIYGQPRSAGACQNTPTVLKVFAAGSGGLSYTWQKAPANSNVYSDVTDGATAWGSTISGSHTDTLTVLHAAPADGGKYRAVVNTPCNTAVSSTAVLTICVADYDCSGFVDTDDFTAFVVDFEAGIDAADVDGTGFVDTDDFTFYVLAFEQGC